MLGTRKGEIKMEGEVLLTALGARGSAPVSGQKFARYGGATTCFRLDCEDCTVFLDAGTGLFHSSAVTDVPCHILLSHAHVDHILGLPLFAPLFSPDFAVTLWGATREGRQLRAQLDCLMRPPLWPVDFSAFRARTELKSFNIGDTLTLSPTVFAETIGTAHPGGCTAYKLHFSGKTLVFATDTELSGNERELLAFARGCDLLLLDAQYKDEEYKTRAGFGHSSLSKSLEFIEKCAPSAALLTHHDPSRRDDELDEISRSLPKNVSLAKEGMELTL